MADQKLSPPCLTTKTEIPAKAGSAKRAVFYTRISTGDQHAETQLYDLRELAKQRRLPCFINTTFENSFISDGVASTV